MKIKSKVFEIAFLAIALIFAVILLTSILSSPPRQSTEISDSQQTELPKYIMKTYNDIIGVYRFGEDEPFNLLNVTVEKLPKNDISALNSGIEIFTDDELFSLTEDFS